ncbi:MAG: hypothetical protein CL606_03345 [Anaerolineaceae bacterium]|nr:hypothetical protein [Anaerolineaceae bacterium]
MMSIQNISHSETSTSFTIVIPTYNEESDIGITLEALSALEYSNFDVLVIDDSTDRTPEVVGKFVDERIKCVRQTRGSGRSAARNQGILVADGDVVVILNADVHLPYDFLLRLDKHYRQGADYVLVESEVTNIDMLFPRYIQSQHRLYYGPDTKVNMNWTEGFSCRRSAAIAVGLFPEGRSDPLVAGEDGWFGELLESNGYTRVFDRSIVVSHIMPTETIEFFAQRVGRGQGVAQIWYQRDNISMIVLLLRTLRQTSFMLSNLMFCIPIARQSWRLLWHSPRQLNDFIPFLVASGLESLANVIGIWLGLIEAWRDYKIDAQGDLE